MKLIFGLPREAKDNEPVGLDVEIFKQDQKRLHRPEGIFGCLSIGYGDGTIYQVSDTADIRPALDRVRGGSWTFHNSLYDLRQLRRWAPITERPIYDTMLVDQGMWGGWYGNYALDDLVRRWENKRLLKGTREKFFDREEMDMDMKKYAAKDVFHTLKIRSAQEAWLAEEEETLTCYYDIDAKAIWPILDMKPLRIDVDAWRITVEGFAREAKALEEQLGFNVKSPEVKKKMIKKHTGIMPKDTVSDTLKELLGKLEDPKKIEWMKTVLLATQMRDAVSKYGQNWLDEHVEEGNLVYPAYLLTEAATGRMASRNPNAQNIPVRHLPIYRTFFIPPEGHVFAKYDIIQQETCFLAYISKDKNLTAAVMSGEDVHQWVANLLGVDRFWGKTIDLATPYGLSPYGIAKKLHVSKEEAEKFVSKYFSKFPGVQTYIGYYRRIGEMFGYVRTVSNRRAWLNPYHYGWKNNAINAPIQGSAADFIKLWLYNTWKLADEFWTCNVVHDEQDAVPPKGELKAYNKIVERAKEETAETLAKGMSIRIDAKTGKNWGETKVGEEDDE